MPFLISLIPKTHWNRAETVQYATQTLSRYQGEKVSHFCSIHALYFRLLNTLANSHTNPYNLRHCVTQIVTHQLQRDVTKIQTLTEIGLPVLAWHQVSLLGLQERGSIGFLYISHPIK